MTDVLISQLKCTFPVFIFLTPYPYLFQRLIHRSHQTFQFPIRHRQMEDLILLQILSDLLQLSLCFTDCTLQQEKAAAKNSAIAEAMIHKSPTLLHFLFPNIPRPNTSESQFLLRPLRYMLSSPARSATALHNEIDSHLFHTGTDWQAEAVRTPAKNQYSTAPSKTYLPAVKYLVSPG